MLGPDALAWCLRHRKRYALLFGDFGGRQKYHVGDEAVLTATLQWLARDFKGLKVAVLSRDPSFTARAHGVRSFRSPSRARRAGSPARGTTVPLLLQGYPWLVSSAGLLHICAAGWLNSRFRGMLASGSLIARAALAANLPVVVTGATIGPALDRGDRELLSRWLPRVSLLGVRDRPSRELARSLGVEEGKVVLSPDDAYGLSAERPVKTSRAFEGAAGTVVGLSLHREGDSEAGEEEMAARIAGLIDRLAEGNDSNFVFLPHKWSSRGCRDLALARRISEQVTLPGRVCLEEGRHLDRHVKWLTGRCDFFISTRYHGLVFALSQGVPCVGIHQNGYSRAKMEGLFDTLGMSSTAFSVGDDRLGDRVRSLYGERGRLAAEASASLAAAMEQGARKEARAGAFYASLCRAAGGRVDA